MYMLPYEPVKQAKLLSFAKETKMNRLAHVIILSLLILTLASVAHARQIKMIFWYPGEAGSTKEAQPILDEFFEYLNGKIAPARISGKYFNTVEDGLAYIKREKPIIGIISYAVWAQNRDKIGTAQVILATLPLPHGRSTERYTLVGRDTQIPAGAMIFSSEPLSEPFIRSELFPKLTEGVKISQTSQLLMKLKEIGEGKTNAWAILSPVETGALARLGHAWAKSLRTIMESNPVPTARVILFDETWKDVGKFKTTLLTIGDNMSVRDILDEMRLKGFAIQ